MRSDTSWTVYSHRRWLWDLGSSDCTHLSSEIKSWISCTVTTQLICAFVFRICNKSRFSHGAADVILNLIVFHVVAHISYR